MRKPRRYSPPRYPPLSPLGRSKDFSPFPPDTAAPVAASPTALSILDELPFSPPGSPIWCGTPTPPLKPTPPLPDIKVAYDFEDYNVVFMVQNTLYRVHRCFFRRESSEFANMFDSNPAGVPISLKDVSCADFDALLEFMYSAMFESEPMSLEKWISVLHVSNMWGMARIKDRAIKHIDDLNGLGPVDRIVIGAKKGVDAWFLPAYSSLVEREEPLSVEEARKLHSLGEISAGSVVGMDIFPLLAQARERFRNHRQQKVITAERVVKEVFGSMSSP